ncbi:23S rRNA (guanosine(2251)-2'-O)-methyltransferase RlmB [Spiroplasma taiwanense]|uniref:tRNA/rRNA methyltransferase n=1 Tax=Spiroplasma taiwanense CT-1 TaxID=1276220 RepID=S5MAF2_9MOLU|nr:23S rRNA (guanosine(2251)-2'-O)-methyltransferase RlmB [Spiroplasma taiwanense]AGR40728.1 tRNA/rRNA methyltransferase [Spiroplasma taiwanense CT-1]
MRNYIYGKKIVENVIKNFSNQIVKIYILKGHSFEQEIYSIIKKNNIKWSSVEKGNFLKIIKEKIKHQGYIAEVKEYQYCELSNIYNNSKERQVILIIDQLQDPQNFGAIIRTASLFNVDGIIIQENNQVKVTPAVVKASVGTIYNIPIVKVSNLKDAINSLKNQGFWIYSSFLGKDSKSINEINFDKKTAIVIGNEATGISKKILSVSDFNFKIETSNVIDSLNVSVATGIILFKISAI